MEYAKLVKEGVIVVKLIQESISFAFQQLKNDKFRTFLSLFGVTIGIFSIVAIFTAIDAMEENARKGLDEMNPNVIFVSQFPMAPETEISEDGTEVMAEFKWWEYMKRPIPSYNDFKFLSEHSGLADAVCMSVSSFQTVQYGRETVSRCNFYAISHDWPKVSSMNIELGRYFSADEGVKGSPVVILGYEIARELFGGETDLNYALNKTIKLQGVTATVIGILKKEGESMVRIIDNDNSLFIPLSFGKYFINYKNASANIFLVPKENVAQEELINETTVLMRGVRRLTPGAENNFSVGSISFITDIVGGIFSTISTVGWIIAAFSLLIGGFGIANIMFVSVKERTNIIGIQKALGAKRYVILTQFLVESIFLALAGGTIGILIVCAIVAVMPDIDMFTARISVSNIISGLVIAVVIGVVSGIIPAITGAKLNPVDAINSK